MGKEPTEEDVAFVTESLGRKPEGLFTVAARDESGNPRVIRNDPLLTNGRPMPTLYWLVDPLIRSKIGTLESRGGVKQAEKECDSKSVKEAHERYSKERDLRLPDSYNGPKPSGGVGGTRKGVKCLHAHYAWFLADGKDPVGVWVDEALKKLNEEQDGSLYE